MQPILEAAASLSRDCREIADRTLTHCHKVGLYYNPLEYAWAPHAEYIRRFAGLGAHTLLVGMNPGHGMGNTGIPFGCPEQVRKTLRITNLEVGQPPVLHPKRPVYGLQCPKPEISGRRIWSLLSDLYGDAESIHREVYIVNHCPLWMFTPAGGNLTPDMLNAEEGGELLKRCDQHLLQVVSLMGIKRIVAVGNYAHKRISSLSMEEKLDKIPHPSPASPLANRNQGADWRLKVRAILKQV
jgi:single-strand selective monofunctional uracil DNA glycosylase